MGIKSLENFSLEIEDIFKSLEFHIFNGAPPYFFKIDIEGSEYRILESLVNFSKDISGMVIEFHDVDLHLSRIEKFIKDINIELCHIHPNNYANTSKNGIPVSLELTFSKNPLFVNDKLAFPNPLDQKNNPNDDDIDLKFSN